MRSHLDNKRVKKLRYCDEDGGLSESSPHSSRNKPFRNAGKLGGGRVLQAVCSLGVTAVATRAVGAEGFGALVLLHSGSLGVAQLVRSNNWMLVVRFGADALREENDTSLRDVLRFGFALDMASALLGGLLFVLLFLLVRDYFGIAGTMQYAWCYGLLAVPVMNATGAARGTLQLFDRFNVLALQSILEPLVRLAGGLSVWALGGGLTGFVLVWLLALFTGRACLFAVALKNLGRAGYSGALRFTPSALWKTRWPMWRFTLGSQFRSSLNLGNNTLPILLVGAFAGSAGAGLFRVAQQISDVITKMLSKLLFPALLPEVSRLSGIDAGDAPARLAWRTSLLSALLAAGIFGLLVLFGRSVIDAVAGEAFSAAFPLMLWLAGAGVISVIALAPETLLLSSGAVGRVLASTAVQIVVGLSVLGILMPSMGALAAGPAAAAGALANLLFLLLVHTFAKTKINQ